MHNAWKFIAFHMKYFNFPEDYLLKNIYVYRKTLAPITGAQREFPLLNTTISAHSSILRHVGSFLM